METIFKVGKERNPRLWPAILNPTPLLDRRPLATAIYFNSAEEVQLALPSMYHAWYGYKYSTGAVQILGLLEGSEKPEYDIKFGFDW